MLVDVTFDGVSLVKGATARPDGNGWFVELEQPMPVGTLLHVSGETQATVRVERVTEGVGAGMLLLPSDATVKKAPPPAAPETKKVDPETKKVEPEAKKVEPEAKKVEPETKKIEPDGDDEPDGAQPKGGNGAGKDRRKKARKTVMGH